MAMVVNEPWFGARNYIEFGDRGTNSKTLLLSEPHYIAWGEKTVILFTPNKSLFWASINVIGLVCASTIVLAAASVLKFRYTTKHGST